MTGCLQKYSIIYILITMSYILGKWRTILFAGLLVAHCGAFALTVPFVERFTWNDSKLIPADSFVYRALETLAQETGRLTLVNEAPLSVRDFKIALEEISTAPLSPAGITLYNRIVAYLEGTYYGFGSDALTVGINAKAQLGVFFPATDKNALYDEETGEPYHFHTWDYAAKWEATHPLLSIPIFLTTGNVLTIETVYDQLKQNYWAINTGKNPTNMPFGSDINYMDFSWPQNAYASVVLPFAKKSSFFVQLGKKGLTIGTPSDFSKSIILSDAFDTDFYTSIGVSSPHIRYQMDVLQVQTDKYLYLHQADVQLFSLFSLGLVEGTLVNRSFELRFLNPLMIMHSFSAATTYGLDEDDPHVYANGTTSRVSQYFAVRFELVPVKHVRIYGLFAQNEIQLGSELKSKTGKRVPNGLGFQGGFSSTFAGRKDGFWEFGAQGLYTSPYCYVRYEPETSFVSTKSSHASGFDTPVYTWIGSQYGPDSANVHIYFGYESFGKWKVCGFYNFLAHGENEALELFKWMARGVDVYGTEHEGAYTYYPASWLGEEENGYRFKDYDECVRVARDMGLSGTVEYTHTVGVDAFYHINTMMSIYAGGAWRFICNAYHKKDDFVHYPLLSLEAKLTLF